MRFTLLFGKGRSRFGAAEVGRAGDDGRACSMRRLDDGRKRTGKDRITADSKPAVSSERLITVVDFLQARDFASAVNLAKTSLHHNACVKRRRRTLPSAWPALRARACGCFYVNGGEAC